MITKIIQHGKTFKPSTLIQSNIHIPDAPQPQPPIIPIQPPIEPPTTEPEKAGMGIGGKLAIGGAVAIALLALHNKITGG